MTWLYRLLRRDQPDRPLMDQMRDAWPKQQTARVCCDPKTSEPWDKSDGREKLTLTVRVLRSVLRKAS